MNSEEASPIKKSEYVVIKLSYYSKMDYILVQNLRSKA
jgi:hypothetical protein